MTKEQKIEMYSMRLDGCTYQEIANKFGVTRQCIQQILSIPIADKGKVKALSESCIYDGLSKFIVRNSVGTSDIAEVIGRGITNTRQKIVGEGAFNVNEIYKILQYTGMTFEECFRLKESEEK